MRPARARPVACSAEQKEHTLARRTCPPITITRIPVILHTRIIGCSAPSLSLSSLLLRRGQAGSNPARALRPTAAKLRLASYQKFICLPTNSSKSIDSSSEAPPRSLEEIYLPAVYPVLLLMSVLSIGRPGRMTSEANAVIVILSYRGYQ